MDQFYVENLLPGLFLDGLIGSHSISVPIHDPKDVASIFDAISYQKVAEFSIRKSSITILTAALLPLNPQGASIIRMLMSLTGEERFRVGLQEYLNKYKYQNAEGVDLWNVMQNVGEIQI